ncbi:uncharacterized protein BDZ99DRAFT_250993 [Mytilinidion resinicola]|uniref:Zn(2)-C6 fungal-type domain-containing protein n=1 Tax=Mytilinidion resinicola TaxID=574789 RepID=A0A6A6YXF3_9PEZI|nr:uncharacterized protein BDZ99DRAFT_250993 [Mytilinidion resinicola]KAF2813169.1 hypothetical protein BDZ99DRAFT_250993 [Mytilinidion resinicola]
MSHQSPVPDDEFRQLLRQRFRRQRNRTSCYPCRTRKVKCDREQPCANCAARGYPELCTLTPRSGQSTRGTPAVAQSVLSFDTPASEKQRIDEVDQSSLSVSTVDNSPIASHSRNSNSHVESNLEISQSAHHEYPQTGELGNHQTERHSQAPFLGPNSMLAFIQEQSTLGPNSGTNVSEGSFRDAMMPILGLQETGATYPFLPPSMDFIPDQALPEDREVVRLFEIYRSQVHSYTPIISDIEELEVKICTYLEERRCRKRKQQQPAHDRHMMWFGLVFAVLASACQFSEATYATRQQRSQAYVRVSFQALRLANLLLRPSTTCVEALLILGNVLQNNMQPEAAWMLLGMTVRMAQSLGLHQYKSHHSLHSGINSANQKLWLAAVWHDTLLSLCFDRPSMTAQIILDAPSTVAVSYAESMYKLCDVTLRGINSQNSQILDFNTVLSSVARVESLQHQIPGYLRSVSQCFNFKQRCEHSAFRLHTTFLIAWLCRPALRTGAATEINAHIQPEVAEKCKQNLIESVRAFLQLHSLSIVALRSWAMLHNGLSSALLLALIGANRCYPEVDQLHDEVLEMFTTDSSERNGESEGSLRLSKSHARAISVLESLRKSRLASERPASRMVVSSASTEPRNGTEDMNFSPVDATTQALASLNDLDASMDWSEMSPLELFDTILSDGHQWPNDEFYAL